MFNVNDSVVLAYNNVIRQGTVTRIYNGGIVVDTGNGQYRSFTLSRVQGPVQVVARQLTYVR
jgi:hypothetical protein